jgi:NAD+ diphosphatase
LPDGQAVKKVNVEPCEFVLQVDEEELEDARWFTRNDVLLMLNKKHPQGFFVPPEQAIAHHLIRAWVSMTANL